MVPEKSNETGINKVKSFLKAFNRLEYLIISTNSRYKIIEMIETKKTLEIKRAIFLNIE
ncbi:hypothetical protein [uncultured Tenacibaculum sp.]|uniref:hypothetical protein n=1 Tax=uncultured Tenacibaculum sp. TaxID=174713 RepID=UPI00262455BD|nr:hypothetical protein [uncultured Tenacibaculum sp.]